MAAFARPTRIVRGTGGAAAPAVPVDAGLFEVSEEGALLDAFREASGRVRADMSVPDFLEVRARKLCPDSRFCRRSLHPARRDVLLAFLVFHQLHPLHLSDPTPSRFSVFETGVFALFLAAFPPGFLMPASFPAFSRCPSFWSCLASFSLALFSYTSVAL